jgi:hypothetical protein
MSHCTFLIRYIIRDMQQVHITQRNPHILGLAAGETAREVRIAKHAGRTAAVHGLGGRVVIRLFALRRELLLAEEALSAERESSLPTP